ncbi:MAG: recombinase family protein [Desulfomicrobium sp.]|nr:recombinase family protein [Pseudomonadota bacterium]MBV1714069.1 recombinase family protein [Desulfomicrobium sp.]MBU4571606.1 recombinase family protein [Pseudomonadota bacterium]MBU4595754.1 recombinase family protein [Pseudomonadota bacterium]MBV1721672.1 recombinase family protein [Desulfomicrobium sp.]
MTRQCVAYFRVSTDRQGQSGLGLEAQRDAVKTFMKRYGWDLVDEFEEVETGKGRNAQAIRPQLAQALKVARQKKAVLMIAKLDRLARNVAFISNLMDAGVDFVACDMPDANRLTVHILAAVAEDEARRISERTKAALAAKKARGERMGNPQSHETLNAPRIAKADAFAESMRSTMEDFLRRGLSQKKMADELNARNIKSARGKSWSVGSIQNCLRRLG